MGVKYKLVIKKNLGKDKGEVPEKKYAQIVSGDFIAFPELIAVSYTHLGLSRKCKVCNGF